MRFARTALATIVVALAVSVAAAQSGGLTVLVVDANGPLPGATVTISHETGYVKTTSMLSNADGIVDFPVLRPGKGYTVEVSFPGFAPRHQPGIHIRISETQALTVQLVGEIVERVKVTAKSDVVDLEKTAPSQKFSDEFIQDLPVPGRFYQNVLTLAPGVQDADGDGNPNVHGSRHRDFKTEVSGISNVDPLTGNYMSQVNPNSIEEMEVITAGAGVEFGRAQGGFSRIIQKQGSNEFEGVFEFYFRSSKLDGDGAHDFSNLPDLGFDWYQPSLQVSGPLVKDKLWYRLSHELIDQEIPVNVVNGLAITEVRQGVHSDQITWQASPRNKLAFQFQSDPLDVRNFGISSLTPPESSLHYERTGETYSLGWTAPYSPKILIESRVAWQDLNTVQDPSAVNVANNCVTGLAFLESAYCFNIDNAEVSGSYFRTMEDHRQRLTVRSDATVYGGRFWGMQHQFKFGAIVENERYFREQDRRPNLSFLSYTALDLDDPSATPERKGVAYTTFAVPQFSTARAVGTTWGLYAEDQIKPMSNLTITLGMRIDREEIDSEGRLPMDPEGEADQFTSMVVDQGLPIATTIPQVFTAYEDIEDFIVQLANTLQVSPVAVRSMLSSTAQQSHFWAKSRRTGNTDITNTNLSPFLGVSWDPWSNGKTKFAVTARRYYDKIFLGIPLIELESATTDMAFNAYPGPGSSWVVPDGIAAFQSSVNPAVNISVVDRNLETPRQDEFTFQFERELWSETSVRLTYVNRSFRNQYQDVDLNHVPGDYGRCRHANSLNNQTVEPILIGDPEYDPAFAPGDGIIDDCAGEVVIPDGQDDEEFNEDPFSRENRVERPDGITDLYLQNPGWGDIYLVGNFNQIDYEAYVLELVRRQYRSWEMQASYTWSEAKGDGEDFNQALGDDRSLLQDEKGYQSYDQRHVVKVNATTITPWGFRLGGAVTWNSGLPYSLLTQQISFDSVSPLYLSMGSSNSARVRQQYNTHQRNDQRNDSFWNFDLKFTKEMNLGRGLNLQLSAEVFNLMNDGTFIIYNDFSGGRQINGRNDGYYRFGRRWQVGFKMAF